MYLLNNTQNQSKHSTNPYIEPIILQNTLKTNSSNQLNKFSTQNTLKNQEYSDTSDLNEIESDNANTIPFDIKPSHIDQLFRSQKYSQCHGKTIYKCMGCERANNCHSCKSVCIFAGDYISRRRKNITEENLNKKYHKRFFGDIKLLTLKSKSENELKNKEKKEFYKLDQKKLCSKPEISREDKKKNKKKRIKKTEKILECTKTISRRACKEKLGKLIKDHENEEKDLNRYYNEVILLEDTKKDLTQYYMENLEVEDKKENIDYYDDKDKNDNVDYMISHLNSNQILKNRLGKLSLKNKNLNLRDLFIKFKSQSNNNNNTTSHMKFKQQRSKEKRETDFYIKQTNRLYEINNSKSIKPMQELLNELYSIWVEKSSMLPELISHIKKHSSKQPRIIRHCAINEKDYGFGFYQHAHHYKEKKIDRKKKLMPIEEIKSQIDECNQDFF